MIVTNIGRTAILLVVYFLGIISAFLGIAAMCTSKVYEVQVSGGVSCYPRTRAHVLAMTSALVLLLAHTIVNILNYCSRGCIIRCGRNRYTPTTWSTIALVCFIISWLTFVVAFLLLLGGAVLIDQYQHQRQVQQLGHKQCYILEVAQVGVFGVGCVLSTVSVVFSTFYSIIMADYAVGTSFGDHALPNEGGVAMVPPQVPPPTSHHPV
ncbi:uncharacterized protein LOC141647336 [Silene latifolia]|uniref:uncharacterized protein LOC141647336 n=1 Tax=Silene latifolia TaxID=37657 RepID=UPI003D78A05F